MDSTHKTTFYGFYLTTLGLIDKNKTFTPIAWLISSDEKKCSIEKFLSSVFEATKMPTELALVTDDTPIYIDVFKKLCTGSVTHILYSGIWKRTSKSIPANIQVKISQNLCGTLTEL